MHEMTALIDTLDIVVPAYKKQFLSNLLESLVAQTSQKFRVIVADDGSPEPLRTICEAYAYRLPLRYVRFEKNLGQSNLIGHWNRSVELSNAMWILLAGDDDLLEPECVAAFWRTSSDFGSRYDVFSLGIRVIDEYDRIIKEVLPANVDTPAEFLVDRFKGRIKPVPVGYIFSKAAFNRCGGFVPFDRGWHSDDASWALFSAATGIRPVDGAYARWRLSAVNITHAMSRNPVPAICASLDFVSWVLANRDRLGLAKRDSKRIIEAMNFWSWYPNLSEASTGKWFTNAWKASSILRRYVGGSQLRHLYRFAQDRMAASLRNSDT